LLVAHWAFTIASNARGQTAAGVQGANFGLNSRVDPYAGGLAPLAPGTVPSTAATSATQTMMNQAMMNQSMIMMDPLGMSYLNGAGMPMTRTQMGLYMLSTQQRMLGLGNGQMSGVRPGQQADAQGHGRNAATTAATRANSALTRNMNVPGGQAARYFNRGGMPAARSQPYYQRQSRYFPQPAQ
jgi:hypothetical protein